MTPDQREAELRRRVVRFRTMSRFARVALPTHVYAHLADTAFLLDQVDELRRVIAHAPTAAAPTVHLALPPTTTLPTAPGIRPPASPWDDVANQA